MRKNKEIKQETKNPQTIKMKVKTYRQKTNKTKNAKAEQHKTVYH